MTEPAQEKDVAYDYLEPGLCGFLLAEAKERFKAEQDRYGQAYSRAGVFLGIQAIYASALVRFFDQRPVDAHWGLLILLLLSSSVLAVSVVVGLVFVVRALVGRFVAHAISPARWVLYTAELRPHFTREREPSEADRTADEAKAEEQTRDEEMTNALRRMMLMQLAASVDMNVQVNAERFVMLYKASRALVWGLGALIACVVVYVPSVIHSKMVQEERASSSGKGLKDVHGETEKPRATKAADDRSGAAAPGSAPDAPSKASGDQQDL